MVLCYTKVFACLMSAILSEDWSTFSSFDSDEEDSSAENSSCTAFKSLMFFRVVVSLSDWFLTASPNFYFAFLTGIEIDEFADGMLYYKELL